MKDKALFVLELIITIIVAIIMSVSGIVIVSGMWIMDKIRKINNKK